MSMRSSVHESNLAGVRPQTMQRPETMQRPALASVRVPEMKILMIVCAIAFGIRPVLAQTTTPADDRSATSADGLNALVLATLVGLNSPALTHEQKTLLANAIDDRAPSGRGPAKITVATDSIDCVSSSHHVALPRCTLAFGGKSVELAGRQGNELWNAMTSAGIQTDGEMGRVHVALGKLNCVIDVGEYFTTLNADDAAQPKGANCHFGQFN